MIKCSDFLEELLDINTLSSPTPPIYRLPPADGELCVPAMQVGSIFIISKSISKSNGRNIMNYWEITEFRRIFTASFLQRPEKLLKWCTKSHRLQFFSGLCANIALNYVTTFGYSKLEAFFWIVGCGWGILSTRLWTNLMRLLRIIKDKGWQW